MDSIGDYVYLIIIIIAGLSGLLKKKKTNTDTTSEPQKSKRTWEDVLRELTPIDKEIEQEIEQEPIFTPQNAKPIEVVSYETLTDTSSLRAKKQVMQSIFTNDSNKTSKLEPSISLQSENFQFNSIDDARKAFIYSEIFNRKY